MTRARLRALIALAGLSGCAPEAERVIALVGVAYVVGIASVAVIVTLALARTCLLIGTKPWRYACATWGALLLMGLAAAVINLKDLTLNPSRGDFWWSLLLVLGTTVCAVTSALAAGHRPRPDTEA